MLMGALMNVRVHEAHTDTPLAFILFHRTRCQHALHGRHNLELLVTYNDQERTPLCHSDRVENTDEGLCVRSDVL